MIKTEKEIEKCLLIGIVLPIHNRWQVEDHLNELALLARTAGAEVADILIQEKHNLDAAYFMGRGKAEELAVKAEIENINLLIFDDELSPAQVRNLEKLTEIKVIDRTGLILDIFAAHAQTKEAKTQVELAQLNYLLPRLTRQWSHLSRQIGGIGTKGPGETQLETDRRLVRTRISVLNNELKNIEKQRATQRKQQKEINRIALVGYTNAGKSTLMNALTNSEVLTENKLFATLDTTTRRLNLNGNMTVLISDTVGFIRKLPPHLIASFRSTLAQSIESDIILHVVDLSHPAYEEQIQAVNSILDDLGISKNPRLTVFNKVDKLNSGESFAHLQKKFPNSIFISAKKHIRLERLRKKIIEMLHDSYIKKEFNIPYEKYHLIQRIRMLGEILSQKHQEKNVLMQIRIKKENVNKLERLLSD